MSTADYIIRQIEIKPNSTMKKYLDKCFGYYRYCWNTLLSQKISRDKDPTIGSNKLNDISRWMTSNKQDWESEMCSQIKTVALTNLRQAYSNYFKGRKLGKYVGLPKFKSKKLSKQSFTQPRIHKGTFKTKNNGKSYIFPETGKNCTIPKNIRYIKMTEPLSSVLRNENDKIVRLTFFKDIDKYYVSIFVKLGCKLDQTKATESVGIDYGIKHLITTSDNETFDYPISTLKRLNKLKNQYLSKMSRRFKKDELIQSNRYMKTKTKYQKICRRIRFIKRDVQYKIASNLVKRYKHIYAESMSGVISKKHNRLSRVIHDIAWGNLSIAIESTCRLHGSNYLEITTGQKYAPTQTCSVCGFRLTKESKLGLSDRVFKCPICNSIIDRDLNAAKNIKQIGMHMVVRV